MVGVTGNASVYQLALQLVADPRCAYQHPTDLLERAAALIRALYGGGPEPTDPPTHARMREAEDSIAATLRARRAVDASERAMLARMLATPPAPPAPKPDVPDRGWRVKVRPPVPPMPPAPAYALARTNQDTNTL